MKKKWIEDLVVNLTMRMVMDGEAIDAITAMVMAMQGQENTTPPRDFRPFQAGLLELPCSMCFSVWDNEGLH